MHHTGYENPQWSYAARFRLPFVMYGMIILEELNIKKDSRVIGESNVNFRIHGPYTLSEYVISSTSGRDVISQEWSAKVVKDMENTNQINDSNPILLWL